jgi:ribonuclease HII
MLEQCLRKDVMEAGCDEAGRGCLAGPVFAAAVVLPQNFKHSYLNDSKQVSEKRRDELRLFIETHAIAWAVAHVSPREIEKINILHASILAMHRALEQLDISLGHIVVDGNKFKPFRDIAYKTIVKGDGKYMNIAAASILAKTHRDAYMQNLSTKFPEYGWEQNKGYPTKQHREAIARIGPSMHHRKTFQLLAKQLSLL